MPISKEELNLVRPEVIKTSKNMGSNHRPVLTSSRTLEKKGKKKKKKARQTALSPLDYQSGTRTPTSAAGRTNHVHRVPRHCA